MDRRRPIALLAALMLALALCAPAWAQGEDAETTGDPAAVEAQGADGEGDSSTEGSGAEGDGFENTNGVDDVNCEEDFDFQEEAQRFFESQGGLDGEDEDNLDDDSPEPDDGDACESLPSEDSGSEDTGGGDSGSFPAGGVDSGAGGTAPIAEPAWLDSLPVAVIGGLVTILLLGARAVRRRA